ncbi:4-(cytidine 5'-diphospho)-2-C-methyl-D-erythritol kinase [Campylobacter gastrosuis]|uniref:4-(cytidine 5'-diphospho)-2-C-methyl-D-erythritol kinase n=1 Tax=Campylobacter gastrosuis TaxID=2974576 RepID=A0ABT7HLU0_9BACT|nr:4-(cytidine 5'-diphospho)-2-C-methyl-D-erythritol kinase [Campylobacter gastrosuis]MDL0087926.1 4-(cytidine 5'-diphospho)-2-C-methyl-D-erythritol kinase [Campylobacter gastrosuis]
MRSFAKINLFLKVVGTRANYHEIASRFILFEKIFDEISFERGDFEIKSNVKINGENIILRAISELKKSGFKNELDEFFSTHKIVINKQIPMGAGLGGGSSNAATFLNLVNQTLNLKISKDDLIKIGAKIGADVAFFLSGFKCANVGGIGEIVSEFDDFVPDLEIFTPDIFCDTPSVYKKFRSDFMQNINVNLTNKFLTLKNSELLENFTNHELNDLLAPCVSLYPEISEYKNMFLSGSGSTLFKVKK